MTLKRVLLTAVLVLLAVPWTSAHADWRIGIGFGYPVYHRPYPYRVYVAPAPVYYVAPAPVYVQPAPVYVQPPPVYVQPAPVLPPPPAVQLAPAAPQTLQSLPPQPVPVNN